MPTSCLRFQARHNAELDRTCTFKPNVPKRRSSSAPKGRTGTDSPSFLDRVIQYQDLSQTWLEAARKERDERESAGATFQPTLIAGTPSSSREDYSENEGATVFERLFEHGTPERIVAKRAAIQQEMESENTFQPEISSRRSSSAPKHRPCSSGEAVPAFERLHQEHALREDRHKAKLEERKREEVAGCSFKPAIGVPKSSAASTEGRSSVFDRLNSADRETVNLMREEMKRQSEVDGCTFVPKTGRAPRDPSRERGAVHERLIAQSTDYKVLNRRREQLELQVSRSFSKI